MSLNSVHLHYLKVYVKIKKNNMLNIESPYNTHNNWLIIWFSGGNWLIIWFPGGNVHGLKKECAKKVNYFSWDGPRKHMTN